MLARPVARLLVLAAGLAIAVAGCGGGGTPRRARVTLQGQGTTFGEPAWRAIGNRLFLDHGWIVQYTDTPEGAALAQLHTGAADYVGGELGSPGVHGAVVRLPVAVGAVVVAYRLPGVPGGLNLDARTLADIYLGRVRRWDDREIASHNHGVRLPPTPITVLHRSDPSAVTLAFTRYLARGSAAWRARVGAGQRVRWPVGRGAGGNAAVGHAIRARAGAIGFVEQAYALVNDFAFADLRNRAGIFVDATLRSVAAPLRDLRAPGVLPPVFDTADPGAYPLDLPVLLTVPRDVCGEGRTLREATALKTLVDYALGKGQGIVRQLYAPLPDPYGPRAIALSRRIRCHGGPAPTRYQPVKPRPVPPQP